MVRFSQISLKWISKSLKNTTYFSFCREEFFFKKLSFYFLFLSRESSSPSPKKLKNSKRTKNWFPHLSLSLSLLSHTSHCVADWARFWNLSYSNLTCTRCLSSIESINLPELSTGSSIENRKSFGGIFPVCEFPFKWPHVLPPFYSDTMFSFLRICVCTRQNLNWPPVCVFVLAFMPSYLHLVSLEFADIETRVLPVMSPGARLVYLAHR